MDDSMIQQWCLNSLLYTQCIDQFIGIYICVCVAFSNRTIFFSYQKILINIEYAIDLMDWTIADDANSLKYTNSAAALTSLCWCQVLDISFFNSQSRFREMGNFN